MAFVCDTESNIDVGAESAGKTQEEVDLEDGEIEDDEEEATISAAEIPQKEEEQQLPPPVVETIDVVQVEKEKTIKDKTRDRTERLEKKKHEEKGKKHMTEAERSILHLRKREEAQRKKWEKMNRNREPDPLDDDFAKNIEKTLATILNKKEKEAATASTSIDKEKIEKEDAHRGKKRRKNDKDHKSKHRRVHSPKSEIDEPEMLNMRGGSPGYEEKLENPSPVHSEDSYESGNSSDRSKGLERHRRRLYKKAGRKVRDRDYAKEKFKNRDREKNNEPSKESQSICSFALQGKCTKNDCPYSHETGQPMKLELCKFYIMGCCAKGDKCSYMHSEFPCKFYHTGLNCSQADDCKFAHGKPLSDNLKEVLFKHIETAPRDILGGFPRISRDDVQNMITVTQAKLRDQQGTCLEDKEEPKGGIPSLFDINVPVPSELLQGNDAKNRHKPSRWHDTAASGGGPTQDALLPMKSFSYGQDQDMRLNNNGDVDMRTLPPAPLAKISPPLMRAAAKLEEYGRPTGHLADIDIRNAPMAVTRDTDIRQITETFQNHPPKGSLEDESRQDEVLIHPGGDVQQNRSLPKNLPRTQRDLFLRIQAQQKMNVIEEDKKEGFQLEDNNINWYSDDDDDDDNKLTIKDDNEDLKDKEENTETVDTSAHLMSPPQIKPQDVVERLGDLSKIDISAEVTKLLTSMSQGTLPFPIASKESSETVTVSTAYSDPRTVRQDPRVLQEKSESLRVDPRLSSGVPKQQQQQRSRQGSTETHHKQEKISIYEQGGIGRSDSAAAASADEANIDLRGMRSDVDLRNLQLPFKGMQNYTPATEIDASINSHLPMAWKVFPVEVPVPDYTGLKLSVNEAEKTGDPRLRKIFKLAIEETDTPLSPKASPKAAPTVRVDPRLRKTDENKAPDPAHGSMGFSQQLSILQSSGFYQSLTSNQKLLLNQELSQLRNDSGNSHDPVLNSLLSNLNIIPASGLQSNPNLGAALAILSNVSKLNPMMMTTTTTTQGQQHPGLMNQMAQGMNQQGILGVAPGIPNLPQDFQMGFDPRNSGGLLGHAPPMQFGGGSGGFPNRDVGQNNFNNFNDDFYPLESGGANFHGNNRGFNRDRRRGKHFNHRNSNRNFRNKNSRLHRNNSPP